jgi:heme-degrading monooxygenase HmoA
MVRHIVTWNYKEEFSDQENLENAKKMKAELEALAGRIDGIIEMKVCIEPLSTSNKDIILSSLHESEEALAAYQIHPEHKRVSAYVGTVMQNRACIDYYE